MSAQTGKNQNTQPSVIDSKTFYEKYIDHRTAVIIISVVLLFIGLIAFFQICSIQAGWCDGCGCAASSEQASGGEGEVDPSCIALWEFLALCLLLIGAGMLFYYLSLVNSSKKLIAVGNMYGAAEINGVKGKSADVELLGQQTKMFMDAYRKQSGAPISQLDPTILDECPICEAESDSESESDSDSGK